MSPATILILAKTAVWCATSRGDLDNGNVGLQASYCSNVIYAQTGFAYGFKPPSRDTMDPTVERNLQIVPLANLLLLKLLRDVACNSIHFSILSGMPRLGSPACYP
jgi:hypothetical protein